MSKAFVDRLLKEMLFKVSGDISRKKVDALPQVVTVTKSNLAQGIKEGYEKTLKNTAPTLMDADFERAAGKGMQKLIAYLSKTKTLSRLKTKESNSTKVVFTQPRTIKGPFDTMKKGAIQELSTILKEKGLEEISKTDSSKIMLGVERLHQEKTTVGTAQLAIMVKMLNASQSMAIKDFINSEQAQEIRDIYDNIKGIYKVTRRGSNYSIKQEREVSILVDATSKNYPGSEDYDWANLKPKLQKAFDAWAAKTDWSSHKGSKSPKEEATELTEYAIINELSKIKGAKVSKKVSRPKKDKNKENTVKLAQKTLLANKAQKAKKAKTTKVRKKVSSTSFSQTKLYAALNAKINATVAKNMGEPALEYQTGRFASSVKITDVSVTPQGFPSVGYTYQLYPYQTFEPGFAQGDVDRDPRKLIDRSIREIAAQMIMGRLYTRRQ